MGNIKILVSPQRFSSSSLSFLNPVILILSLVLPSCQNHSGTITSPNGIFWEYALGMSQEAFWELSRSYTDEGRIRSSKTHLPFEADLEGLQHDAEISFFPTFQNGKVLEVEALIQYKGWAPWNKALFSNYLMVDVLRLFENWYGKGFSKTTGPEAKIILEKKEKNRKIRFFPRNEYQVSVFFTAPD